jgi:hypothetical protein
LNMWKVLQCQLIATMRPKSLKMEGHRFE